MNKEFIKQLSERYNLNEEQVINFLKENPGALEIKEPKLSDFSEYADYYKAMNDYNISKANIESALDVYSKQQNVKNADIASTAASTAVTAGLLGQDIKNLSQARKSAPKQEYKSYYNEPLRTDTGILQDLVQRGYTSGIGVSAQREIDDALKRSLSEKGYGLEQGGQAALANLGRADYINAALRGAQLNNQIRSQYLGQAANLANINMADNARAAEYKRGSTDLYNQILSDKIGANTAKQAQSLSNIQNRLQGIPAELGNIYMKYGKGINSNFNEIQNNLPQYNTPSGVGISNQFGQYQNNPYGINPNDIGGITPYYGL